MDHVQIINHILTFILALYADPNLPRKVVSTVITFFSNFLINIFIPSLKHEILAVLRNENISDSSVKEIEKCFDRYSFIFNDVDSESKRFTILKKRGLLDIEEFSIGTKLTETIVGNSRILVPKDMLGIVIPLKKSLRMFLQIPGVYNQTILYMKKLAGESITISNIIQGDSWKTKYGPNFDDQLILPLHIFSDDVEVGNALGGHAGQSKLGAVYATIGCLPPKFASRLDCILFYSLIHTNDSKESTNKNVFKTLIEELNFLRHNGISIKIDNCTKIIKFQLVKICGDNLGLNSIFGFSQSFRSNFYCRICTCSSEEASKLCTELECKLRTEDNYDQDVLKANFSQTGIKEKCIFNEVDGFNITKNVSIDLMHDVLEGVCMFIMNKLIKIFAFEKQFFTLQLLNTRIKDFNFGRENKPPKISYSRITDHDDLSMSAVEVLSLVRYFGLIIGDLIPEENDDYQLYITLRKVIDILLSPRVIREDAIYLKELIDDLNRKYIELFGKLKPKQHFLTHYPRIMLKDGPPMQFWAMRFEAKHKPIKDIATSQNSSMNLLKTVALKQALIMCSMMHSLEFEKSIVLGSIRKGIDSKSYFNDINKDQACKYYNEVHINGISYRIGTYLVISLANSEAEFGKIQDIILWQGEVYFYFEIFEEITFDFHAYAYIVRKLNRKTLMMQKNLPILAPLLSVKKKNTHFLAAKYRL